jgi:hypothetical protein
LQLLHATDIHSFRFVKAAYCRWLRVVLEDVCIFCARDHMRDALPAAMVGAAEIGWVSELRWKLGIMSNILLPLSIKECNYEICDLCCSNLLKFDQI